MANGCDVRIIFSVDDHYVPCLEVCIKSILDHVGQQNQYHLYILNQQLTAAHQKELRHLATAQVTIELVEIDATLVNQLTHVKGKLRDDFFTLTIFFRLFIADLFPDLEKAIYLDADTVLLADPAVLFAVELEDHLIAGVPDTFALQNESTVHYIQQMVGVTPGHYVNSGVLVMNLNQLRVEKLSQTFLHLENHYQINALAPDQDYLNAMCRGRVKVIDGAWNAMPGGEYAQQPQLVHFSLFNKPWHYTDVPQQRYFWYYAQQTPYFVYFQQAREMYSDEQKAADQQHAAALIAMAGKLASAPQTFRSVLGSKGVL